jgi:pre-rRNA-processing protein TSR1
MVDKVYLPQPDLQRSLAFEAEIDPSNNNQEQTWPTTEELEKAQTEQNQLKKRVPKGTSEYQAAWIVSDDEDNNSNTQEQVNICISTNTLYLIILGF